MVAPKSLQMPAASCQLPFGGCSKIGVAGGFHYLLRWLQGVSWLAIDESRVLLFSPSLVRKVFSGNGHSITEIIRTNDAKVTGDDSSWLLRIIVFGLLPLSVMLLLPFYEMKF